MTRILGRPQGYAAGVPLKLVIREDVPYRSADLGLSPGVYEATWSTANNRWESGGAELNVVMPRWDREDAIPLGQVSVFISRTDTGAVVGKYVYSPEEWVETGAGVFDLGKGAYTRAWVRTRQIDDLTDSAEGAALRAEAAAQSVTDAKTAQEALAATKDYSTLVTDVKTELARIAGMTDGIAPLARRVTALEGRIADVGGNAEPPVIPPYLTPLYDSLNEVREALGMTRVGHGGEAEAPATTPEDPAGAEAAADQAVSTVATAAEDRAAPLPAHLRRLLDGAGLTTDTLIARATDDELLAISGIGGESLKAIRTEIPAQIAQKDGE